MIQTVFLLAWTAIAAVALPHTQEEHVRVPGTRVSIVPPAGFELSGSYLGFQHLDGSSIIVTEIPGSFDEVSSGMTDEAFRGRGIDVLGRTEQPMGEHPGLLLRMSQKAHGQTFEKWLWLFGSDSASLFVVGQCLKELAGSNLPGLKAAVLSSRWDSDAAVDPLEGLAFRLGDDGGLKIVPLVGGMALYSRTGEVEESNTEPFLVCGPSLGQYRGARETFARLRLRQMRGHEDFQLADPEPIEIDGLQGFAITAEAEHAETGSARALYQVVLFDGMSYWILQASATTEDAEEYLPIFKRMARSFRRVHTTLRGSGLELTVPATWSVRSGLHEDADLEAANPTAETYVIVLSDWKEDVGDMTFEEFAATTRSLLEDPEGETKVVETEIGGRRALAAEFLMDVDGDVIFYRHVAVEGIERYHQLVFWSLEACAQDLATEFDRVQASFRELTTAVETEAAGSEEG